MKALADAHLRAKITTDWPEFDFADQLFANLLDKVDESDHDISPVMFGIYVNLVRSLVELGWTTEELLEQVGRIAADHEAAGRA